MDKVMHSESNESVSMVFMTFISLILAFCPIYEEGARGRLDL